MLSEVEQHRNPSHPHRRWYTSEAADLYIWAGEGGPVSAFEYCYRFGEAEYSLCWDSRRGFEFGAIDGGESSPYRNDAPVRVADGTPPWGLIARHFRCEARALDPGIFTFILNRLVGAACRATPPRGRQAV